MDAAGRDDVFLETVGVGQAEVDIIDHADTVVLALMPGSGDSIQALKAGVMEIPDVIVVNKRDHPLTDTMVREIRGVLSWRRSADWRVPIVTTEAVQGEGVDELIEQARRAPRPHRGSRAPCRSAAGATCARDRRARRVARSGAASRLPGRGSPSSRGCSTRWSRGGSTRRRPRRRCWSARRPRTSPESRL